MEVANLAEPLIEGAKSGVRLGNQISRAISWTVYTLSRPLALVTQVLYRREMGERYFTPMQAMGGLLLIVAATWITITTNTPGWHPTPWSHDDYYVYSDGGHFQLALAWTIGVAWIIVFFIASAWHLQITVRLRRMKNIRWHSRCTGLPRWQVPSLPGVNPLRFQFWIELAVTLVLAGLAYRMHLYGFGILLVLSALVTFGADYYEKKQFHDRMLDAVDSQIESEWLSKAIELQMEPQATEGLKVTLPAYVSKEYRQRVAGIFK